jgi:tyrosinase
MPAADKPYWSGELDYTADLHVRRADAMTPESLGYRYADLSMPGDRTERTMEVMTNGAAGVKPPAVTGGAPPRAGAPRVGAPQPAPIAPPPVAAAPPPAAAAPAPAAAAPVPFRGIWLGRETRSVRMPLRRGADMRDMRDMPPGHDHGAGSDVNVVLDAVTLTQMGEGGGYFYKLYLDLDDLDYDEMPGEDRLLGTIGPFQIAAALSHAENGTARIELPAADLVERLAGGRDPDELGVTFVRVDAGRAPGGSVINIERVEFRGRLG